MPRRKLSDEDKVQAVPDLLAGRGTHAEICNRHGIRRWRRSSNRSRAKASALPAARRGTEDAHVARPVTGGEFQNSRAIFRQKVPALHTAILRILAFVEQLSRFILSRPNRV